MFDVLAISREHLLTIPVNEPERLFLTQGNVKSLHRKLSKRWHPDNYLGDKEVMQHLNNLRDEALLPDHIWFWHSEDEFEPFIADEAPVAEPVYSEPVHEEPVYEEPVCEEPVYEAPIYQDSQPEYSSYSYEYNPNYVDPRSWFRKYFGHIVIGIFFTICFIAVLVLFFSYSLLVFTLIMLVFCPAVWYGFLLTYACVESYIY